MIYFFTKIKQSIIDAVAEASGVNFDKKELVISTPPEPSMGDIAVSCFYLAKVLRRSPNQIAHDLKDKIKLSLGIKSVQNVGPYLNFFLDYAILGEKTVKEIVSGKDSYGSLKLSREKIMLEYSQPNTHKEFHIGHLRNVSLGASLAEILKFAGYKVITANYIGDIGAHVAKCLWALQKFHQKDEPSANRGRYLGEIYAEAAKKTAENPEYKKEADAVLQKLEASDKKLTALWKKTRAWSLEDFYRIYDLLGVRFDHYFFESEVEKPGKKIVTRMFKDGLAKESEGAIVIDLSRYDLKVFLLLKSDGSSLYSTKDLALAKLKFEKFKIDRSVVLVDNRQSFYFEQLFKTLEIIGFKKPMVHVAYEFVTLKDGAMASREGNVVLFQDFHDYLTNVVAKETKTRHQNWTKAKIKKTASKIALAAMKFNMLKVNSESVIVFDIEEAISLDGFSGPYLLYTVSRINSILKKTNAREKAKADYAKLALIVEKDLILALAGFPEAVRAAALDYQPSVLAKYLFNLAKKFSAFYQEAPVLNAEPVLKKARLDLVEAVRQVLINGLHLLNIESLDEM